MIRMMLNKNRKKVPVDAHTIANPGEFHYRPELGHVLHFITCTGRAERERDRRSMVYCRVGEGTENQCRTKASKRLPFCGMHAPLVPSELLARLNTHLMSDETDAAELLMPYLLHLVDQKIEEATTNDREAG